MSLSLTRRPLTILTAGALTLVVALSAGGAPAGAASADAVAAAPAVSGASTSVTVFLKAPDAAALTALANQPMTNRATRMAQLAKLVPSQAQRSDARSALTQAGFKIGNQTTWSLTASAPRSLVTSLFGTPASGRISLPLLPSALRGLISTAYLTTGGTPLLHQSATETLTGNDVRDADTTAGSGASGGANDAGVTVATLQLADMNPANPNDANDLTSYANQNGIADPVAGGRYHPVRVDGGPTTQDNAGEGDIEVALDQESILSTAPTANQQPYFAPNTSAGFNDVFANAYDDVTGNSMATHPNPHLIAMSVSWGGCEAAFGTAADINTTQSVIAALVAAGVNIFSASGDDGIYDCRSTSGTGLDNSQEDVDFPASSPSVVAVGGTNLSAPSGTPPTDTNTGTGGTSPAYDGSNWTETSWSCADPTSCQATNVPTVGTGGTGGGVSGSAYGTVALGALGASDFKGFAKPAYQSATIRSGAFARPTTRMVPDIAADGDPDTGFVVTSTGMNLQVGGTSLAAPLSAAQFANTLGDAGITSPIGDIHAALYSAYTDSASLPPTSSARVFRDVTVGSNGAAANATKDPSVSAGVGYDTNTGLGGVLWPGLTTSVKALAQNQGQASRNTITAKIKRHTKRATKKRAAVHNVRIRWKVRPGVGNAIAKTVVTVRIGRHRVFHSHSSHGRKKLQLREGRYVLKIRSFDLAGHKVIRIVKLRVHGKRHHHDA